MQKTKTATYLVPIGITLTPSMVEELDRVRQATGISRSLYIRHAVAEKLQKDGGRIIIAAADDSSSMTTRRSRQET
jgi:metal-responsive CopG/Arc/MetJ family transcriptional regulator